MSPPRPPNADPFLEFLCGSNCLPGFGLMQQACPLALSEQINGKRMAMCHAEEEMSVASQDARDSTGGGVASMGARLLLGIDTCGQSGSVALGRLRECAAGQTVDILDQIELEGRSYSSTLISAIDEMLGRAGATVSEDLHCLVAVCGPGSFTGVRVGLSTVKGLAEAAGIPIVAVSRLEVLAAKAGVVSAALDAHRSEVFLRIGLPDREPVELLAGPEDLAAISPVPNQVAVCDGAADAILRAAWPKTELMRAPAPTAAEALRLAAPLVASGKFVDPLVLDGHYIRRSDAEIFGEAAAARTA